MEERHSSHIAAGKIAEKILDFGRQRAKVGKSLFELAEEVEAKIVELGGKPGFPLNLSVNDQAAHYTPKINDDKVIGEKDVLKFDCGVHVNGFIADCAFTIDFSGENGKLVEASKQALENALSIAKAGKSVREIGKEIETTIKKYGLKPVENLCGHSIEQYIIHAGITMPNIESGGYVLKEGDVFAIEPFATNGRGRIADDHSNVEIFMCPEAIKSRMPNTRKVSNFIESEFKTMPFCKRWIANKLQLSQIQVDFALNDLNKNNSLSPYPVLKEVGKGLVSQAETTIIVEKDGCKVMVGNF